eukprot:4432418-Prymnesium_polylepis.1
MKSSPLLPNPHPMHGIREYGRGQNTGNTEYGNTRPGATTTDVVSVHWSDMPKHPRSSCSTYVDPITDRNAVAPIYRPSVLGHITSGAYATRARARSANRAGASQRAPRRRRRSPDRRRGPRLPARARS